MDRKNGHPVFQVLSSLFRNVFLPACLPASLCIGTNKSLCSALSHQQKRKHSKLQTSVPDSQFNSPMKLLTEKEIDSRVRCKEA